MWKVIRCFVFVAIVTTLLASSSALAQGKGKGQGFKPPGHAKGEKKNWKINTSRGVEKLDDWIPLWLSEEEKEEWKQGRPPGWNRGRKKGWRGADMPPGLAKKDGQRPKESRKLKDILKDILLEK